MEWIIYLVGSGQSFFWGIGLLVAGTAIASWTERGWSRAVVTLCGVVGVILIGVSATPISYAYYAAGAATTLIWLVCENGANTRLRQGRRLLRVAMVCLGVLGVALELPWHFGPRLSADSSRELYIIGDSVAAGMADREAETWPRLLSSSAGIEVHDFSRMGATARSAMKQADSIPTDGGVVLLEIGGNDVLGVTSAAQFESDLDQLLNRVCTPRRTVLMFELPLPPFANEFGRAQRHLAARYRVLLIPKRILLAVLTTDGATLDSIHLSRRGHRLMADVVWQVIGPVFGAAAR